MIDCLIEIVDHSVAKYRRTVPKTAPHNWNET